MKKICVLLAVIVLALVIAACLIGKGTLITSQESPNGDYTVHLYQIGSPGWPFGAVSAKLVLENSEGDTIDKVTFDLANDGGGVYEGNIEEIHWLQENVEIIMGEADTTKQYIYILYYDQ